MKNILKGWFTSIVGCVLIILTGYMIYSGKSTWVWEGISGVSIGTVLLLSPRTLEKVFEKIIEKITK